MPQNPSPGRFLVSLLVLALPFAIAVSPAFGQDLQVRQYSAGTLNEQSSLELQWTVVNDPAAPVELLKVGVHSMAMHPDYFRFYPAGLVRALEEVSVIELRYLLFNAFDDHFSTLSTIIVRDLKEGAHVAGQQLGIEWRASFADTKQLAAVLTVVAHVRTKDGKVWSLSVEQALEAIRQINPKLTAGAFEPTVGEDMRTEPPRGSDQ